MKDVLDYAEPLSKKGFNYMDSPGFDPVSVTGQVASGSNIICFTTGRGSCFGCKPVPSLKLSTNTAMYEKMEEDMDINCGTIAEGIEDIEKVGSKIFDLVVNTAEAVIAKKGVKVSYSVGTMIELPRACVVADQIAEHAEFFSFGTNDLTQTTLGVSRDDAGRFLPEYVRKEVLEADPFVTLDTQGVGQLMEIAVERGRSVKPAIKLGICGEHGGDP